MSTMDSADGEDDAEDEDANKAAVVVVGDSLIKTLFSAILRFSFPHNNNNNNNNNTNKQTNTVMSGILLE